MTIRKAVLVAMLSGFGGASAQAQVPHTFSAGSAAKASEVNDNFTYLNNLSQLVFASEGCLSECQLTARSTVNPDLGHA